MKNIIFCPKCQKLMVYNKELGFYQHVKPTSCKFVCDKKGVDLNEKYAEDIDYENSKLPPEV